MTIPSLITSAQLQGPGMWVSRPGLGLETDQDHFVEVLVLVSTLLVLVSVSACLVLVSEGGLEQDLRLCATATLLVSKVETSKWMCSIIYLFVVFWQTDFDVFVQYYIYCSAIFKCRWMKTVCVCWSWPRQQRSRSRVFVLVSTLLVFVLVSACLVLVSAVLSGLGLRLPGLDNISAKDTVSSNQGLCCSTGLKLSWPKTPKRGCRWRVDMSSYITAPTPSFPRLIVYSSGGSPGA